MVLILEIFVAGCLVIFAWLTIKLAVIWAVILYYLFGIVILVLYISCAWVAFKILRKVLRAVGTTSTWVGIVLRWIGTALTWLWWMDYRKGKKKERKWQRARKVSVEVRFGDKWPWVEMILRWLWPMIFQNGGKKGSKGARRKVARPNHTHDEKWEVQVEAIVGESVLQLI